MYIEYKLNAHWINIEYSLNLHGIHIECYNRKLTKDNLSYQGYLELKKKVDKSRLADF